jgi:glycosyltransferase involved in cell wall biosynthesis
MRKPTILLMNRVYPPVRGASGRMLRDLARGFARDGWQVTVVTTGPKAVKERDGAVRVIRVKAPEKPSGVFGYLLIWIKMFFVAARLPATELLVTMTDPPMFAVGGALLQKIKKNHHIHWVQDVYPDLFPLVGAKLPHFSLDWLRRLNVWAVCSSERVVVIGRCMARRLGFSGVPTKQIAVVPNWPDPELGEASDDPFDQAHSREDVEAIIAQSGRAENYRTHDDQLKAGPKFRVLYAGNIGQIHPINVVLNAARILQNQNPEIEFLFVGDGPKYDAITRAKAQEHLDNVKLLPYQPPSRLKELMESGDVHLISLDERAAGLSVPSKLYSALAAHRPSIYVGPSQSEAGKVIEDYKIGTIVGQGQAEELASTIRDYRMNSDLWFSAHENAKKAAAVFLPAASIGAFIDRAWQVLGGRPNTQSEDDIQASIAAE